GRDGEVRSSALRQTARETSARKSVRHRARSQANTNRRQQWTWQENPKSKIQNPKCKSHWFYRARRRRQDDTDRRVGAAFSKQGSTIACRDFVARSERDR